MPLNDAMPNGDGPHVHTMPLEIKESKVSPIAIIGMACRTPGEVSNPEELWEMCSQQRSGWSEIPASRFNHEAFYHPNPGKSGCLNPKGAHFLQDDIAHFDNAFFRISDKEASVIDPQQRILLECAYEAIENASLALSSLAGKDVGVFAAQGFSEYAVQMFRDPETLPMFMATGSADSLMSNRISYAFDLRGPSLTVDTACSSGLTAMHLACQSLRAGETKMAIAGGCHLNLTPDDFISFSMSNLLSDHGKSMAFDARATSGFGRGEGVGCVVLKPLDAALQDGDIVRAVIKNSGINQDGKTVGITMPSRDAQEALMRAVYHSAGLNPLDTQYIESHGTGTAVGDPVEAAAIGAVFGRPANSKDTLYVGSVKSNIGHLEGASGIVAIIKAALMTEKGFLLPNCDHKPNPAIPFDTWNMKVPDRQALWPRRKLRRASVNNFGFGGSNAHFILEQSPRAERFSPDGAVIAPSPRYQGRVSAMVTPQPDLGKSRRLIVLSASSEASLIKQAKKLLHYLQHRPEALYRNIFGSLALTLQRRSLFQWRLAISATTQFATVAALQEAVSPIRSSREPRIGFVFTGQGAQWYAMGRELMYTYPVYTESLLHASDIMTRCGCNWSLIEELSRAKDSSLLRNAYLAQPSCTAVQLALVDLLDSWNIRPDSVVGHSSGEIAAAYASKAITFETGMLLAYHRGTAAAKLLEKFPATKGAMLAIGGLASEVDILLRDCGVTKVVKACINSPGSFTISGDESEIDRLEEAAKSNNLFSRKLQTEVAYHSQHMTLVAEYYRNCIGKILPKDSSIVSFHSSLHGQKVDGSSLSTDYWVNNLTSPVLFSDALESLCNVEQPDLLLEIGPHTALKGPIREILFHMKSSAPEYLPTLVRFEDAVATMFETAARLVVKGSNLKLSALNFPIKDPRQPAILTDLEPYSWDHSKRHWCESRIAQGYRLRQGPRNDMLGSLAADSNDLEPRWRNIIRIENLPWLEQHNIQGNILYPMAGFVAMGVEALRARAMSKGLEVRRYVLRDVHSSQPLSIPPDTDVETMVTLRPYNESAVTSSGKCDEFRIMSYTKDRGWSENCRGIATVETDNPRPKKKEIITHIVDQCISELNTAGLYDMLEKLGVQYGPLFYTGMVTLATGPNVSAGTTIIPDTAAAMPYHFETDHVIHPATLDTIFQFFWPMLSGPSLNLKTLHIPVSIKSISISSGVPKAPGTTIRVYANQIEGTSTSKKQTASFFADHEDEGSGFAIEVDGLTLARIAHEEVQQRGSSLAYKLDWKPDIGFLSTQKIQTITPIQPPADDEVLEEPLILEQASLIFFRRALAQVPPSQFDEKQPHLRKLYDWMTHACELGKESSILLSSLESYPPFTDDVCLEKASRVCGTRGELTCLMGENIPVILRGEVDPLSLLLKGDLLKEYYTTQDSIIRSYQSLCRYVDLIAHQNPALRILEIGAGTGGATLVMLETLAGHDGGKPQLISYDYTDISSGFFDAAKEKFESWNVFLKYRVLDIGKDAFDQGFDGEAYDLIVASNVLHATSLLADTMGNVHKLLKSGGKLIMIEETVPALRRFPFATLPGWWLSQEPDRLGGPLISEERWDALLRGTGFSGLDICLQDYEGHAAHTSSIMVSTALAKEQAAAIGKVMFIATGGETPNGFSSTGFESAFESLATLQSPNMITIEEALLHELHSTTCIFLDDLKTPFLTHMNGNRLEQIKHLFQAQAVIWVTNSLTPSSTGLGSSMISGFARSLRSENTATKIVMLHSNTQNGRLSMDLLRQIYQKTCVPSSGDVDFEYMEHDCIVHIPRVHECDEVERTIAKHGRLSTPEPQDFVQKGRQLTLKHDSTGMLSGLYFDDLEVAAVNELGDNRVQIEIKAMAVNFKDVVVALGQVDGYLGHDCSGIVTQTGGKVTHVSVGDRVCALGRETFSTVLECNALQAVKIPDNMNFTDAAAIPAVFCTSLYSLVNVARLQAGESVLIHAAAGGVGQAAIMIAQMIGADIYATVGSEEKKEHLMATYGLHRDQIFSSRTPIFAQQIRDKTHQRGVDVVLNSLGGELLRTTWGTLANHGRFVELGKLDIERNGRLDMATFAKSTTFAAVDLQLILQDKPAVIQELLVDVIDMFRTAKLRNITPIQVLPIDALGTALHDLQRGKAMGKIVIEPLAGQQVQVMPTKPKHPLIRPDVTYLITGGAGGLGRSMTKWLIRQGAKSVALASRTGRITANVKMLTEEYSSAGIKIAVLKCDIGDEGQVQQMMEQCSKSMAPIRGVIHGAMVLHDKLFEQTNAQEYNAIMAPKVRGAWNLHNALPKNDLDFFVLLSSAAGIVGTRGQAVYAGTSTFLGAFARWRQAQNLPANALYLGAVAEVGYVAERVERQKAIISTYSDKGLTEREFLAFLRAALDNQHTNPEIYTSLAFNETSTGLYWASDAKFRHLRRAAVTSQSTASDSADDQAPRSLAQLLAGVDSLEAVQESVAMKLKSKICSLLMLPEEDLDPKKAVVSYGLDSLVAVELRNWIAKEAGAGIQLMDLMTSRSLGDLAALVTSRSRFVDGKKFAQVNGEA